MQQLLRWILLAIIYRSVALSTHSRRTTDSKQIDTTRNFSRTAFIRNVAVILSTRVILPQNVRAVEEESLTDVYFGTGCFWHIQHEFVESERKRLNRPFDQISSRAGYAGGKTTDKEGRVCYHNLQGVADYGKLGHGEVVGMKIPQSSIVDFASDYLNMFGPNGERVDYGDRGGEYRALIGLPDGMLHPSFPKIEAMAQSKGMKLLPGLGNEPDTYGTKTIYVYDTKRFPFFQAEVYHQYHNDFQSPPYGKQYNNLAEQAFLQGRLKLTGCPDRV